MGYQMNAQQGERLIAALNGESFDPPGPYDNTANQTPVTAEQGERLIAAAESGSGDGGYYEPAVDENGNLSWTASKSGMPEIDETNIKGPQGEPGEVTEEELTAAVSAETTRAQTKEAELTAALASANVKISGQQRQIKALQDLNHGQTYTEEADATEAYSKAVPSGAMAVTVNKVGGRSVVLNQIGKPKDATIQNHGISATIDGTGKVVLDGDNDGSQSSSFTVSNNFSLVSGRKYLVKGIGESDGVTKLRLYKPSGSVSFKSEFTDFIYTAENSFDNAVVLSILVSKSASVSDRELYPQCIDLTQMFGAGNEPQTVEVAYAMGVPRDYVPYNTGEIISAELQSIEIKKADTTSLGSINLPGALLSYLADKGYGQSPIGGAGNLLDLQNKTYTQLGSFVSDEWVALEEPIVYDISSYLPDDDAWNFLNTEPGGSLTFVQQDDGMNLAVPQELVWAVQNSEVTA